MEKITQILGAAASGSQESQKELETLLRDEANFGVVRYVLEETEAPEYKMLIIELLNNILLYTKGNSDTLLNRDAVVSAKIRSQVPIIMLFAIVGYAIAAVFYCLYGIAADTIILCFFADKQLAEQGGRPVSAPAPLQEFYEQYKS